MSSALILDSSPPNVITRDIKLAYLDDRLSNHELHAFMNLADELKVCNFCREETEELFGLIQHLLGAYHKFNRDVTWTHCPIEVKEYDEEEEGEEIHI